MITPYKNDRLSGILIQMVGNVEKSNVGKEYLIARQKHRLDMIPGARSRCEYELQTLYQ
jgi:hypothetical protein